MLELQDARRQANGVESDACFAMRPRGAQVGAWASGPGDGGWCSELLSP